MASPRRRQSGLGLGTAGGRRLLEEADRTDDMSRRQRTQSATDSETPPTDEEATIPLPESDRIAVMVTALEAAQIAFLQKQLDQANSRIRTLESMSATAETRQQLTEARERAAQAERAIEEARTTADQRIANANAKLDSVTKELASVREREQELNQAVERLRREGKAKEAELEAIRKRAAATNSNAPPEYLKTIEMQREELKQRAETAEDLLARIQQEADQRERKLIELQGELEAQIQRRYEREGRRIQATAEAELSADDKAVLDLVKQRRKQQRKLVQQGSDLNDEIWNKMNSVNRALSSGRLEDYRADLPSIFQTLEFNGYMDRVERVRKLYMYRMIDETEVGDAGRANDIYRSWLFFELEFALTLYLSASFQSDYDAVLDNLARTSKPSSPGLLESFLMQNPDIGPPFTAERFNGMVAAYQVRTGRNLSRLARV